MNEVAVIRHAAADVDAYRASTEAANICKEIVVATSSTIQGKRYVAVEGWQAIAIAHGCALSARDVERVDGGVRAIGEVRRMSDGQMIATAEGYVGEDEAVWFGGTVTDKWGKTKTHDKRADYAIRAMAQTRAMSRAGRTAFAHVVVMMNAGLATTPAEEMVTFDTGTGEIIGTGEIERTPPPPGITKIKNNLNKLMRDGNRATDLQAFRALVKANKDDLKTIREANHSYWTGDGEDFEGFEKWMERRYAELTPQEQSLSLQMLLSLIAESKGYTDLQGIIDEHGQALDELEDVERRRFETAYNDKEAQLLAKKAPTPLETGLVGG